MTARLKILLVVVAVVVIAGAAVLVRKNLRTGAPAMPTVSAAEPSPEVKTAKAGVRPIARTIELPGIVEPVRLARIASAAEGPVEALYVREGDRVEAGQRLLRIGRGRGARARLASDREELRKVEDELERVRRLVDAGAVPGDWLDKARADHERARAQVEAGEESTGDYGVRAPWTGVVSRVLVSEGNFVAARTVLIEIFDPGTLVVRISLPEAFALRIEQGARARVTLDALGGGEIVAKLTRLYPDLDRRLRTRVAELVLEGAPRLAPGASARVQLAVESVANGVVIPSSAIVGTAGGGRTVFVVEGGKARRRDVETGIEDGSLVQVRLGVSPGDEVVVAGAAKLKDGVAVRAKLLPAAPAPERDPVPTASRQGAEGRAP